MTMFLVIAAFGASILAICFSIWFLSLGYRRFADRDSNKRREEDCVARDSADPSTIWPAGSMAEQRQNIENMLHRLENAQE